MVLLAEIGVILLFSIVGGVLAVRFKQPTVLGLILIGALVGPNALGFVNDTELIENSIEIGAVLLLFTLGIEFSLQKILGMGFRAVVIAAVKIGTVFFISYYSAFLLGLEPIAAIFIGVILSITSTVIVIKILEQKGMAKAKELPLLITILILEDIFAIFALTFFSGLNEKAELAPGNILAGLLISISILIIAYLILQRIFKPIVNWLAKYSTEETVTFLSLGLCGIMSYIAIKLNLSPSVGAFLAGNIVASFPNSKLFEKAIHPFLLTFTSLFFFSIGTNVNFSQVASSALIILALFAVNTVAKFLAVGFGSYVFAGFSGKQAVLAGIAMVSVGEFSLLIAKESGALGLGLDLVSITASIIFLSAIAMNIMLSYNTSIYNFLSRLLPKRVTEDMGLFSKYLSSISFRVVKERIVAKNINLERGIIIRNSLAILMAGIGIFLFFREFSGAFYELAGSKAVVNLIFILLVVLFFFPVVNIFKNTDLIIRNWMKIFMKLHPREHARDRKMFTNFIVLAMIFTFLVILPFVSVFAKTGTSEYFAVGLLGIILIWRVLRSSTLVESLMKKKEAKKE